MASPTARASVITEADTCREFVTPRLVEAGWGSAPHAIGEQSSFTNGRIIVAGGKVRRGQRKRADYLLYYRRDYQLAVVDAKERGKLRGIYRPAKALNAKHTAVRAANTAVLSATLERLFAGGD